MLMDKDFFMKEALKEAMKAYELEEIPIGAVIVKDGEIIARGYNRKETDKDATLHGEMIAIREACNKLGAWRLLGCTMYVTLEPCSMCAGAIVNSRIENLVIATKDYRTGACGSVMNIVQNENLNHRVNVEFGVMEQEASNLIKEFFIKLRNRVGK